MVGDYGKIVFLAQNIGVLNTYARLLAEIAGKEEFLVEIVLAATGKRTPDLKNSGIRTVNDGTGAEKYLDPQQSDDDGRSLLMFMTFKMAEGINLQAARALGIIEITSDVKSVLQGMGRIDRIDSPHERIYYRVFDIKELMLSSDGKAKERVKDLILFSGAKAEERNEVTEENSLQCPAYEIVQQVVDMHRMPRNLRDNNLWDVLASIRSMVPESAFKEIGGVAPESLWGTSLCFLRSEAPLIIAFLEGRHPYPPRFVAIRHDGDRPETVRDQVEIARTLREAYGRTKKADLHLERPSVNSALAGAERAYGTISGLRHWDIRPDRLVSSLWSLDRFLCGKWREDRGERRFGHLPLKALERLAECWIRELDPAWQRIKRDIDDPKQGGIPDYCGVTGDKGILELFIRDNEEIGKIRGRMEAFIEKTEKETGRDDNSIIDRVSVVFCSTVSGT